MEGNQDLFAIIIAAGSGLFALLGALFNWNFFFEGNNSRLFMSLLGRTGSRIFYAALGLFLLFCAFNMVFGFTE